jgi:hypothetical protein
MSKAEKALLKIRQNPKSVRFEEIDKVLNLYGFERRQSRKGTSHYVYILKTEHKFYRVTIPFKRPFVKKVYIQQTLEIIAEVEEDKDQ